MVFFLYFGANKYSIYTLESNILIGPRKGKAGNPKPDAPAA